MNSGKLRSSGTVPKTLPEGGALVSGIFGSGEDARRYGGEKSRPRSASRLSLAAPGPKLSSASPPRIASTPSHPDTNTAPAVRQYANC